MDLGFACGSDAPTRASALRLRQPGGRAGQRGSAWRDLEWVKLLVDGRLLRSIRLTRSFKVLSYPSGMTVSSLWVPETAHTAPDLPFVPGVQPGMIR
jgi:hypothetical protein